jgi:hypothetical protein
VHLCFCDGLLKLGLGSVAYLRLSSGGAYCQMYSRNGFTSNCVHDGVGNHGNSESCTVQVLNDGQLESTGTIRTECGNDVPNVKVNAGTAMTWRTDGSVTHEGFDVCVTPPSYSVECSAGHFVQLQHLP